ncbi:transposase [Streptomyces sp. NPDC102340]|uniref:transposase n=1 Tax=unclassified Streptomyces TaxID=2593676 RepID=UPI00382954AC
MEADGREALGRSRGGLTGKVHFLADDRARPLVWQTSPGQRGDIPMLVPVLERLRIARRGPGRPRTRPDRLRGDKAYSSRDTRAYLRRRHIKATIAQPDDQRCTCRKLRPCRPVVGAWALRMRHRRIPCENAWHRGARDSTSLAPRDRRDATPSQPRGFGVGGRAVLRWIVAPSGAS